jgi:hypothetical protein
MSRQAFLARRNCGALMLCAASLPRASHHPARRGRKHRSGKCDSQQARAKQDKTGNGHREETVRSEFFAHGAPPTARKSDCQQGQLHTFAAIAGSDLPLRRAGESQVENIKRQSFDFRVRHEHRCDLPPAIDSSRLPARLERLRLMAQFYVATHLTPKGIGRVIWRFSAYGRTGPSSVGVALSQLWKREFSN